jgi:hypothetical protein
MNGDPHLNDPAYWRKRAKGVRALADHVSDLTASNTMLRIAEDYERLAERQKDEAASWVAD